MSTVTNIGTLIVRTPQTCGGRPRIAGTRISVQQIAVLHKEGLTIEEILQEYSILKIAEVYAALAYYYANKEEIDTDLQAEETEYERLISEP